MAQHSVLIVGCGNIAGGFDAARAADAPPLTHAGAFSRHEGFRIAACVEPDADRRAAFATRWGVPRSASTLDELQGERFDIISLCSPTALHEAHLEAALAFAPRLIFCEKPLTPTVAQSEHAVRRCRDAGVLLAVNHNRRWSADVARLRAELQAGAWGALRSASGTYNKGVLNNGSHLIDLLHALFGRLDVIATGAPQWDHWSDDPTVPALLQTANGVPVHLSTAHAADYALFELTLVTEQATLTMEEGGIGWRVRRRVESPNFRGYHVLDDGERSAGDYLQTMRRAVENLHAALADEAELLSTGASALQAQRLCERLRHGALNSSHA